MIVHKRVSSNNKILDFEAANMDINSLYARNNLTSYYCTGIPNNIKNSELAVILRS